MILIDSNVFVAYAVETDSDHAKAVKLIENISNGQFGPAFTSDYVFDETETVTFVRSKSLDSALLVGNYIRESMEILKIGEDIFENAWRAFKDQKSSKFSFTDCTNIALMEDIGINNIATFDKEFIKVKSINVIRDPIK